MSSRTVAIRLADGRVRRLTPGEKLTLGRTSKNDLKIVDKANSVSRTHAIIAWKLGDDAPTVTDQNSSNGTIVNGTWIKEPVLLKNGDEIRLGQSDPILVEFRSDLEERGRAGGGEVNGSTAVIIKPESQSTDRWTREEIQETAALMGWLRSTSALVDVLRTLEEDRKTGILTLGNAEDKRSINVLAGRIVAARVQGLVGQQALDQLLELASGSVYRFVDQTSVPRGGLSLRPGDLPD